MSRRAVLLLKMEAAASRLRAARNEAIPRLDNVVVATISSRTRGPQSEVPLGPEDGMPRECAISLDNLRTVPKALLVQPITKLGPQKDGRSLPGDRLRNRLLKRHGSSATMATSSHPTCPGVPEHTVLIPVSFDKRQSQKRQPATRPTNGATYRNDEISATGLIY